MVVLTETGSWSGSGADTTDISYMDINYSGSHETRDYRFWEMKYNSTTPIFTSQYSIRIPAGNFNTSMNSTTRIQVSGSIPYEVNEAEYANLRTELTPGSFSPYFNQIQFYRTHHEEPVLVATLPRPVKKRDDIDLIVTFRVDH